MLLRSVLSAIPIFHLSVFLMPVGVRRRIESLMKRFFWKGSGQGQNQGMVMVAWDKVCMPTRAGALGVLDLQAMNTALLTKWVAKVMNHQGDVTMQILKDQYGKNLNWET